MDIEVFRIRTADQELTDLARENTPEDIGIQDLDIKVQVDGIAITGKYTGMMMPIQFETFFEPVVSNGIVEARLTSVKVAGFSANNIRKVLLSMISDLMEQQPGLSIDNETIRLDLSALLAGYDLPLRVVPKNVHCQPGFLIIDGGI